MKLMQSYFNFEKHGTSYRQETLAGITTFFTLSYIIIVNPAILAAAGIPKDASMTATILTSIFGTLLMGVYAKRPFAGAPYMGENGFIAYVVLKLFTGRVREVRSGMWILAFLSCTFYLFYPYH